MAVEHAFDLSEMVKIGHALRRLRIFKVTNSQVDWDHFGEAKKSCQVVICRKTYAERDSPFSGDSKVRSTVVLDLLDLPVTYMNYIQIVDKREIRM